MKYVDAFSKQLLQYANQGLDEAKRTKAKKLHIWWAGMPFFARAFNLSRYIDGKYFDDGSGEGGDGADGLDLPAFPVRAIAALAKQHKAAEELFRNEDGTKITDKDDGWDAAFDGGPYIEAGEWTKLVIDARICAVAKALETQRGAVKVEVCGDGGEYPFDAKHFLGEIKELRKERGYSVDPEVIKAFLDLLTDEVDPAWIAAAAKLK